MAQNYGPRITTENLLLSIDPSQNTSYPAFDLPIKNGLVMWMDAADDTTFSYSSGTTVSQWRDKSGFNYHMVPKVSGPTRSSVLNSRKVLAFTASQTIGNDVIDLSSTTSTVFVVSRYVTGTNQRVLTCNLDSGGGNWLLGHWGGYVNQYYAEGWVSYQVYGNDTVWRVYMGDYSGPPAGVNTDLANIYSNGTAIVTNSTAASGGLRKLGINYYSNETSTCEVAEIVVFNRVLSTRERNLIHTYLGQKWGISNTDRQIFDLSGNNFNFSFNGTNPRYNSKTIISNFNTSTPYAMASYGGQNLTSRILNLLYTNHTIEVALNPKAFAAVIDYNAALNYEFGQGIVLWTGYHSGLYLVGPTLYYVVWDASTNAPGVSYNAVGYKDKIMYISARRSGNILSLYINGILVAGPTDIGATASRTYTQINIGAAFQGDPSTNGFAWASQHEFHLLRMYDRALTNDEIFSNYQAFKARFDNNIVRFGLVFDLDAGNPTSYAGAGTTWYDVSGNTINASATGTPTYSSLNSGTIYFYPSVSSYYNTSAVSALNLGSASFSMEAWVYLDPVTGTDNVYRGIISFGTDSANFVYIAKWRSGLYSGLYVQYKAGGSTITGVYQGNDYNPVSRWTHVVATKSSNVLYFYVNGTLYSTASNLNTTFTGNSSVYIGQAHGDVASMYGYMGEVRVYNVSLSAAQVLQNYNATKGRFGL